jgi:hypothetical protein
MQLMTKEIEAQLPPLYSTENVPTGDKIAVVKFFDPSGRYTFYVCEGSREDDDVTLFGYGVSPLGPDCDEWGYASLNELQRIRGPMGLGIERDLYFQPQLIKPLIEG